MFLKKLCKFKLCLLLCLLTGCGTLHNGRGWGQDVVKMPRLKQVRAAAVKALRDPHTWVPAVGAVAMNVGGFDREVSRWAAEEHPLFGSTENARAASDAFRTATEATFISTALFTPSGDYLGEITTNKLKGIGAEVLAAEAAGMTTMMLKGWSRRTRPDGSDNASFPSAHSTSAFSYAALSRRNTEALNLNPTTKTFLNLAYTSMAAATAWGRVEGEAHYPSDVLAGAALGNFMANFFYNTFLDSDHETQIGIAIDPKRKGATLEVKIPF